LVSRQDSDSRGGGGGGRQAAAGSSMRPHPHPLQQSDGGSKQQDSLWDLNRLKPSSGVIFFWAFSKFDLSPRLFLLLLDSLELFFLGIFKN
jgi:hypothetical protein